MTGELRWMAIDCFIKTGRVEEEDESCSMFGRI